MGQLHTGQQSGLLGLGLAQHLVNIHSCVLCVVSGKRVVSAL